MPNRDAASHLPTIAWRLGWARKWLTGRMASLAVQAIARIGWLHWLPRLAVIPIERALIRHQGTGLFDPRFYLDHNTDVRGAGIDPFTHYLRWGWREGRAPNARFDAGHYRAEAGMVRGAPISPLAHFLAFGRRQGLCPVPGVDLRAYRVRHPALQVARIDPYQMLLREPSPHPAVRPKLAPLLAQVEDLVPPRGPAVVNVVVPVYLGRAETLNTLVHVLSARSETRFSLIVVNDASPDADLAADLRTMAARGLIELLENAENRGFVASVNIGTALHPERDVIWLNSDTEVYDGWIDRLRATALSAADIATVTPLTNNGTICSYPRMNADNPGEQETTWAEIDALAAQVNAGLSVVSPTAVGFATYVKRAAIQAIGPLDEKAFGRGYGEENDFSQRAVAAGWSNVIASDVFVRHFGATSFQGTRADRIEAALKVLDRRYPGYRAAVADFLADDPLAEHRRALDLGRLAQLSKTRNVLLVTHSRGGGTQQHIHEEIARLSAAGASVYLLSAGAGGMTTARLDHCEAGFVPGLAALPLDGDALWDALAVLRISEVHIHHLIDFGRDAPEVFYRRLVAARLRYTFVLHDYYAVCPRINLTDSLGHYCGEPDPSGCRACLARRGAESGIVDIGTWRERYRRLLLAADRVVAPDRDGRVRLFRYFPEIKSVEVVPHEKLGALQPQQVPQARRPGPLRIAVIGSIGPCKGFDVLLGVARHLRQQRADVEIQVIGYTRDDEAAKAEGIAITGPYLNAQVDKLVREADPDVVWIPSIWPETYCYTLSVALRSGRPVAAFAIGALASRLDGVERAHLMPIEIARRPSLVLDALQCAARPVQTVEPDAVP